MSPRAAWRLESLGFGQVYDYVAGKADWGAVDLPLEGTHGPRVGEAVRRDTPTCSLDEPLSEVQARVLGAGWDTCIVVNEERVVLGRLGRSALAMEGDMPVEEAMSSGPSTVRPNASLDAVVARLGERNLTTALVTRSDGRLLGIFRHEG